MHPWSLGWRCSPLLSPTNLDTLCLGRSWILYIYKTPVSTESECSCVFGSLRIQDSSLNGVRVFLCLWTLALYVSSGSILDISIFRYQTSYNLGLVVSLFYGISDRMTVDFRRLFGCLPILFSTSDGMIYSVSLISAPLDQIQVLNSITLLVISVRKLKLEKDIWRHIVKSHLDSIKLMFSFCTRDCGAFWTL